MNLSLALLIDYYDSLFSTNLRIFIRMSEIAFRRWYDSWRYNLIKQLKLL